MKCHLLGFFLFAAASLPFIHTDTKDAMLLQPVRSVRGVYKNHVADKEPEEVVEEQTKLTFDVNRGFGALPPKVFLPSLFPPLPRLVGSPDGFTSHLILKWGGHDSFLLQFKADPESEIRKVVMDLSLQGQFWAKFPEQPPFLVYKRMTPPGFTVQELGKVDLCFISHNHLDHCDKAALHALRTLNPDLLLLAPEGTARRLSERFQVVGIDHNWWSTTSFPHFVEALFVPAHHASGTCDEEERVQPQQELWGGWGLRFWRGEGKRPYTIYMVGDTSCHAFPEIEGTNIRHIAHHRKMFQQISQQLGHVDLILFQIDPWRSEEEMHYNVKQGAKLLATYFPDVDHILPMHYGTWCWGDHPDPNDMVKPLREFKKALSPYPELKKKLIEMGVGEEIKLY